MFENDLAETIELNGEWLLRLGDHTGTIQVPGCWEAQGYPRRIEGPAFYSRVVTIPPEWQGQRVQVQFDAVSYYVEVTVNGQPVGIHTGAWSAFALDVTDVIRPGTQNEISLTIYKTGERFPLRESLVGFLPDVALMFGGIWQSVRLVAFPGPALSDIRVLADTSGRIQVNAALNWITGGEAVIRVIAPGEQEVATWRGSINQNAIDTELFVNNPVMWSPESPNRYRVEIELEVDGKLAARAHRMIGFRELSHEGHQLLLNSVPFCLRGVLNWGWYPDILCPVPDEATIRDEFRRVRELGYNMVKLCLYVPSPLYFEIADEEGMLLWLELPLWLPDVTPRLKKHAPIEYAQIMEQIHHHPAVVIYSLGCELERHVDPMWIADLNSIVRTRASNVLFCDNSGSGEAYGYLGDLADFDDYHFYADLQFFEPLLNHFRRDWRKPRPLIFGEFCDADDYRDLNALQAAYDDELPWWVFDQNPIHPLSKLAYSQQLDRMQQLNLNLSASELVRISRQQSFIIRKTILERTRARDGVGGYIVTSIRDTPLSTSSMFDDLGHSKYVPSDFRRFNTDTILLIGRGRARRWTRGGDRPAPFEPYSFAAGQRVALYAILAHTGQPLPGGVLFWRVETAEGAIVAEDTQQIPGPLAGDGPQSIGSIIFGAPLLDRAATLKLFLTLELPDQIISNEWPLWIFPVVNEWPQGIGIYDPAGNLDRLDDLQLAARVLDHITPAVAILITSTLNNDVMSFLRDGGSVLLLQQGERPLPTVEVPFWREAIKIIEDHPAMNAMPHNEFVDLQFYGLAPDRALAMDALSSGLPDVSVVRPILRRLDARQFILTDYLVEARVGSGRLIASTLRFTGGLGDQPVGLGEHLAGRWLLTNLLKSLL